MQNGASRFRSSLVRWTNLTLSANGCDSVKFLGLVGWGDESLWKEKRMRSASQKRAHCSNLCIVTAKKTSDSHLRHHLLGLFLPAQISLPVPSISLAFRRWSIWRRGSLFEKSGRQSRGCFNRLYKYLHSHGLTPWTTYYSISLSFSLPLVWAQGQTRFFTSATHPLRIPHSLHSYDSSTAQASFDPSLYSWGILEVEVQLPDQICPLDM